VTAHGSTIQLYLVEPHGSRFVFSLPVEEVPTHG
jgi:K+-sensing histidine kinase KdpD